MCVGGGDVRRVRVYMCDNVCARVSARVCACVCLCVCLSVCLPVCVSGCGVCEYETRQLRNVSPYPQLASVLDTLILLLGSHPAPQFWMMITQTISLRVWGRYVCVHVCVCLF